MKKSEKFFCECGTEVGYSQGNWYVIPNPPICKKCNKNLEKEHKEWMFKKLRIK